MANNVIEDMSEKVKKIDNMVQEGDMLLAGANLYVTSLIESYKEERLETQRLHEKEVRHWKHVVITLAAILGLFIGGIIGGAIYLFSNYDFAYIEQNPSIGNDGDINVHDGVHYDYNRGD